MKKLALLLILSFSTIVLKGQSYTLTDDDVVVDENGFIQSCSYNFEITDIIIPEVLDGKTVLGISNTELTSSDGVFSGKRISSVELPNTLKEIGSYAFDNNLISSVSIPNSVTTIGSCAFSRNLLTGIAIPNSITSIGISVFEDNRLKEVTIPDNVTYIGLLAFAGNDLVSLSIGNGVDFIGTRAFESNKIESLNIPAGVKQIESRAFFSNNLKSVVFEEPSQIFMLHSYAFAGNDLLSGITLPTNSHPDFIGYRSNKTNFFAGDIITDLTSSYYLYSSPYTLIDDDVRVSNGVIKSCSYDFSNKSIIIPEILDGQEVVGIDGIWYDLLGMTKGIFQGKGITSLVLPATLKTIGERQFASNFLSDLVIPKQVTSIGRFAFENNDLVNVIIPGSVEVIGYEAFDYNNLSSVVFQEPSQLRSVDTYAFGYYLDSIILPLHGHPDFSAFKCSGRIVLEGESIAYNGDRLTAVLDNGYVLSYYHWSASPSGYSTSRRFMVQDSVFVLSDEGNTSKADYRFIGWNTKKDGSGSLYNAGNTLTMPARNLSLYAQWIADVTATIKGYSPDCASRENGYLEVSSTATQNIACFIFERDASYTIKPNKTLTISNLASGTYNLVLTLGDDVVSEHTITILSAEPMSSRVLVDGSKARFSIEGGVAPYQVFINDMHYITETGYLETAKLKSGSYTATIIDANHCSADNILTFSVSGLIVYQNPVTNGILKIALPVEIWGGDYGLTIYSLQGGEVFTKTISTEGELISIDVSSLVEGSYLLNVVNNAGFNETVKLFINQ